MPDSNSSASVPCVELPLKLLVISASPRDKPVLAVDEEIREIKRALRASRYRDRVEISVETAALADEFAACLYDHAPHVLHFTGYHSDDGGITLLDDEAHSRAIPKRVLLRVLSGQRSLRLVVLNTCFSLGAAQSLVRYLDLAIGVQGSLEDKASVVFASQFYSALGNGRSVQAAFDQAITPMLAHPWPDDMVPQLRCRRGLNAADVVLLGAQRGVTQGTPPSAVAAGSPKTSSARIALARQRSTLAASNDTDIASAQNTLVWLHLSDLHLCRAKTGWDAHRVLDCLRDDLRLMESTCGLTPQFVFFTGDAAFGHVGSGKGESLVEQFDDAHRLLEEVRGVFQREIPRANVFLVPGNHDVDRREVAPDQTDWLDRQTDAQTITDLIHGGGTQWRRYMDRLSAYRAALARHGYDHLLQDSDRLIYAAIREIGNLKVGIAGFNSAWSCGRDAERGHLWLGGDWQIGELTQQLAGAHLRIALMHHPLGWFVEYEDPVLRAELEREFTFLLHGHEHQGWVDAKMDGHVRIAAAACYARSTHENGYNFVQLNLTTGEGAVWLRRYDSQGGGWVPRVLAHQTDNNGMWRLGRLSRLQPWLQQGTGQAGNGAATPLLPNTTRPKYGRDGTGRTPRRTPTSPIGGKQDRKTIKPVPPDPKDHKAKVLFDEGHGQAEWDSLSPTVNKGFGRINALAGEQGFAVATLPDGQAFSDATLHGYQALVLAIGPEKKTLLTSGEIAAVQDFVRYGGGLLVMGTYTGDWHHEANLNLLLGKYGIAFNRDVVTKDKSQGFPQRPQRSPDPKFVVTASAVRVPKRLRTTPAWAGLLQGVSTVGTLSSCSLYVQDDLAMPLLRSAQKSVILEPIPIGIGVRIQDYRQIRQGPAILAAASKMAKVVVVGGWKMFLDGFIDDLRRQNGKFFQNILAWLTAKP